MNNPLIILILDYLKAQSRSCSLCDLVNFCEDDLLALIGHEDDYQRVIFKKNFFVMNALYQIQQNIQTDGFMLTISALDIALIATDCSINNAETQKGLATRDKALADYYLNWANLNDITVAEIDVLFASFWQQYQAIDKVSSALITLGLEQNANWFEIRTAYKNKVAINHPDKGGKAEDFIAIRKAYDVLRINYGQT